jgi:hypothetical protein
MELRGRNSGVGKKGWMEEQEREERKKKITQRRRVNRGSQKGWGL